MSDKIVLDEEMKKRLSGLLPTNSDFTVNITPSCYDGIEEQFRPVFTLRPLNNKQLNDITKNLQTIAKDDSKALNILKGQIVGWSNVMNISTCEEVPFESDSDGSISNNLFNMLPKPVLSSLVVSLLNISGLKSPDA
jgi:hypothetical protein